MRAHFGGDYKFKKDVFYKFDFINDKVLTTIYDLLKEDLWERFLACFADLQYDDNINQMDLKIVSGGVPGLYTMMEGILLVNKADKVWGAFLYAGKLYYFTSETDYKKTLPGQVENWRTRFKEVEIVYLK